MNKFILILILFIPQNVFAEGAPWRTVVSLGLNQDKAGLRIEEGDYIGDDFGPFYYELDSKSWELNPITNDMYETKYAKDRTSVLDNLKQDKHESTTISGKTIKGEYLNCTSGGEGDDICKEHYVYVEDKRYPLNVTECKYGCRILFAEIINDRLWLAMGRRGEYGIYGAGIQVYELNPFKRVFQTSSLKTGTHVNLIKENPFSQDIWLMTDGGLEILDKKLQIKQSLFFSEDFNPQTHVAQVVLKKEKNDITAAIIARRLKIEDPEFYNKTKHLPVLSDYENTELIRQQTSNFLPHAFNILLPYVFKGLTSDIQTIKFYAERVLQNFKSQEAANYFAKPEFMNGQPFEKFKDAGLIPDTKILDLKKVSLQRLEHLIQNFNESTSDAGAIIQELEKLSMMKDTAGFNKVNDLYKKISDTKFFWSLDHGLFQKYRYSKEIAPAMYAALTTFKEDFDNSCRYFKSSHFIDVKYPVAIVKALVRMQEVYDQWNQNALVMNRKVFTACYDTFNFQLENPEIRRQFEEEIKSFNEKEKSILVQLQGRNKFRVQIIKKGP